MKAIDKRGTTIRYPVHRFLRSTMPILVYSYSYNRDLCIQTDNAIHIAYPSSVYIHLLIGYKKQWENRKKLRERENCIVCLCQRISIMPKLLPSSCCHQFIHLFSRNFSGKIKVHSMATAATTTTGSRCNMDNNNNNRCNMLCYFCAFAAAFHPFALQM